MARSAPQPRSRKTPSGGRRIAKLGGMSALTLWRGGGVHVHDLQQGQHGARAGVSERRTLQMSEPVKGMVMLGICGRWDGPRAAGARAI